MSRVNSDEQRIQELNETQLRQQKQAEKRDKTERSEKSFNQVMSEKTQREQGRRATEKETVKEHGQEKVKTDVRLKKNAERLPKSGVESARRAALFQRTNARQAAKGASMTEGAREADGARTTGLVEGSRDERERLDVEVHRDDLADARMTEEQFYELRADAQAEAQGQGQPPVDRDRGSRGGRQQSDQETAGVKEVESKGAAGASSKLTQELIDKIVDTIYTATQTDGRTEVMVSLKGTMLDGVTLKVALKKGKIHCSFEGCDKDTRRLIEASKGELMRGLARKGLDLEILRVK